MTEIFEVAAKITKSDPKILIFDEATSNWTQKASFTFRRVWAAC